MERFRIDLHARPDLLDSLDDNALAGFNALTNDPVVFHGLAEGHGPNDHLVIAADHGHLARALLIEDRLLRYKQRSMVDVNGGAHSAVLAGAQNIAGIRKEPGDAYGPRLDVDLAVRKVHLAFLRECSPVGKNEFELHAGAGFEKLFRSRKFTLAREVLLFADGEIDFHWIQRRDGSDSAGRRAHKSPDLQLRYAWDPVDGRSESRESQIDARRFHRGRCGLNSGRRSCDLGFVGFDLRDCRLLLCFRGHIVLSGIVEILLGDCVLLEERCVAVHIQLDAVLICVSDRDLSLSLRELCARLCQLALGLRKPPSA